MMEKHIAICRLKESLMQSIVKDTITFTLLIVCIVISFPSIPWSIFTILMFILYVIGTAKKYREKDTHVFTTKEEAHAWIDSLEENK